MVRKEIEKSLNDFQVDSFKGFTLMGFNLDIPNVIFGIIIEMRNIVLSAEKRDTILLHKYMGLSAQNIANFAEINNLKLSEVILENYKKMEERTAFLDLEYFLELIRKELSLVNEMAIEDKKLFLQKCWICTFIEEYHNDFLKTHKILKQSIEDNKIKYPEKYSK